MHTFLFVFGCCCFCFSVLLKSAPVCLFCTIFMYKLDPFAQVFDHSLWVWLIYKVISVGLLSWFGVMNLTHQ